MKKFLNFKLSFIGPNFYYLLYRSFNPKFFFLLIRYIHCFLEKPVYHRLLRHFDRLGIFKAIRYKNRKSIVRLCMKINTIKVAPDYYNQICFKSLRIDESIKPPEKIDLASGSILWSNGFLNLEFEDPEDFFSIHRFVWLIKSLNSGMSTIKIEWVIKQIQNWCIKFQTQSDVRVFESYSISERLVSWCFIIVFIGQYIDASRFWSELRKSIEFQLLILIKNLEYHGKFTNNHILNNARCLYICGRLFKLQDVENLGKEILFSEFREIIQDGMYQEGSSHYQMLLTKSFLEIRFIAELTEDFEFLTWVTKNVQEMRIVCANLQSQYSADEYPFFGDISPDVEPSWMLGYPFSYSDQQISPWQKLFQISVPVLERTKDSLQKKETKIEYVKLTSPIWEVWVNIKRNGVLCHGHNDNGQVVVFKKGKPVLIDIGLSRYLKNVESANQIDPISHCTPRFQSCPIEIPKSQGTAEFLATRAVIKSRTENSIIFDIVYYSGKIVTREIRIDQNKAVKIFDRLSIGNKVEKLNSSWHFASSEAKKTSLDNGMLIEFKDCATVEVRNTSGSQKVSIDQVFRSTSYGSKIRAIKLNVESQISLNDSMEISIH
jgi:hypothetical protein